MGSLGGVKVAADLTGSHGLLRASTATDLWQNQSKRSEPGAGHGEQLPLSAVTDAQAFRRLMPGQVFAITAFDHRSLLF